jgi:hypothetical protein
MYISEVQLGNVDWKHLAQVRDQWQAVVNMNEPSGCTKCKEFVH